MMNGFESMHDLADNILNPLKFLGFLVGCHVECVPEYILWQISTTCIFHQTKKVIFIEESVIATNKR